MGKTREGIKESSMSVDLEMEEVKKSLSLFRLGPGVEPTLVDKSKHTEVKKNAI